MYSKDYNTSLNSSSNVPGATSKSTGGSGTHQGPKSSSNSMNHSSNNANQTTTLNKSLESVIRKAAYKGIEPLRRRYTAATQSSSAQANASGSSYAQVAA